LKVRVFLDFLENLQYQNVMEKRTTSFEATFSWRGQEYAASYTETQGALQIVGENNSPLDSCTAEQLLERIAELLEADREAP